MTARIEGIEPCPPIGRSRLPWDEAVADPVGAIGTDRGEHGDTFALRSGGQTYLFVFSSVGVRSFYALPEGEASKGIADWRMLRRKVPDELFAGRRTHPAGLFGRDATGEYLRHVDEALGHQMNEMGLSGSIEIFALTRRLGHRIGLASWGPPGVLEHRFDELLAALDLLDGSASFVRPGEVIGRGERVEEQVALETATEILAESMRVAGPEPAVSTTFEAIAEKWADEPDAERREGTARDVILVHMGSMSNLFAALGWTIVYLLRHPDRLDADPGDRPGEIERCCLESIRMAQRSIMMREVVAPVDFDAGDRIYRVDPGVTIATLLPLTNRSAGPGLDHFDPDRWKGRRLAEPPPAGREMVATFGHGEHTCPAQPFSLSTMAKAVVNLMTAYEFVADVDHVEPRISQIGGVARSESPCVATYRRRRPSVL